MPQTNVFYVDDDHDDIILVESAIQDAGIDAKLHVYKDGNAIIEACNLGEITPDIILVDDNLPGMKGLDVLMNLRANRQLEKTPILILSGNQSPKVIESYWKSGATLFISKFPSFGELKKCMKHCLQSDWTGFRAYNLAEFTYCE